MKKIVKQYRFYHDNDTTHNYPGYLKREALQTGAAFFNDENLISITQLGIQTIPGVEFVLNNNVSHRIIIGPTGIFELDLEGISTISNLYFDPNSLEMINNIDNAYLIVDAIYNTEE